MGGIWPLPYVKPGLDIINVINLSLQMLLRTILCSDAKQSKIIRGFIFLETLISEVNFSSSSS